MRLPLVFARLRAGMLGSLHGPSVNAEYRVIAGKLRLAREAARISRAELAAHLGVTESTLTHWECGLSTPAVPTLIAWAHAVGMRIDALNARRRLPEAPPRSDA